MGVDESCTCDGHPFELIEALTIFMAHLRPHRHKDTICFLQCESSPLLLFHCSRWPDVGRFCFLVQFPHDVVKVLKYSRIFISEPDGQDIHAQQYSCQVRCIIYSGKVNSFKTAATDVTTCRAGLMMSCWRLCWLKLLGGKKIGIQVSSCTSWFGSYIDALRWTGREAACTRRLSEPMVPNNCEISVPCFSCL